MNTKSVQCIVVTQPRFQLRAGEEWDASRCNSDYYRASRSNISARRSNYHESAHSTGTKSQDTRFTAQRVLEHGPRKRSDRSGKRRTHERVRSDSIGRQRASRVET